MPIYKRCSRCGKRVPSGTSCPCIKARHREYDKYSRDKKCKQFYAGREWRSIRSAAIEADDGMDVYLFMTEGKLAAADTVHHIIPLQDDWQRRLDINNLMSLNHDTHSMIERMYRKDKAGMEKKLQKMLLEYRNK